MGTRKSKFFRDQNRQVHGVKQMQTPTAKVRGKSEEFVKEDGHTDVASAKNQVQITMSALQKMQTELDKLSDEDELLLGGLIKSQ